jgi:hypothetical protein
MTSRPKTPLRPPSQGTLNNSMNNNGWMRSIEGQHVTEDEAHNSISCMMKRCEQNAVAAME